MRGLRVGENPSTVRLWSLTADALVEDGGDDGPAVVVSRWGEWTLPVLGRSSLESLRRMGMGPVALGNTVDEGDRRAERASVTELETVLRRIAGSVVHSLAIPDGSGPLLSAEPITAGPTFDPVPVVASARLWLPPTAGLWPVDGALALEVPGAPFRVLLHRPLARWIVTSLVAPATTSDLAATVDVPEPVVGDVVAFLLAAGVVERAGRRFGAPRPEVSGWGQHELQFHSRTRTRTDRDVVIPTGPLPTLTRLVPDGPRIALHRPDLTAVAAGDPPLTALLETDHRDPALIGDPPTAAQLGELLYRSVRIRSTSWDTRHSDGSAELEWSQRPYSSTAEVYELELFLTLDGNGGLPRGIHHYDPLEHALTLLDDSSEHVDHVLDVGRVGMGSTRRPPAVITIGARIGRSAWLGTGSAYATSLRHCGALQETLRLVAASMGVGLRAIPTDAQGVDELLGMRWPAEVGLGECAVGLLPRDPRSDEHHSI